MNICILIDDTVLPKSSCIMHKETFASALKRSINHVPDRCKVFIRKSDPLYYKRPSMKNARYNVSFAREVCRVEVFHVRMDLFYKDCIYEKLFYDERGKLMTIMLILLQAHRNPIHLRIIPVELFRLTKSFLY